MKKNYPILKKLISPVLLLFALLRFKQSIKKIQLLSVLVFLVFSFKGNAQCTISGATVNSSSLNCSTFSSCSTIYVGNGTSKTDLIIENSDLDFRCLGAIQFVVRDKATIIFKSSGRLYLPTDSNIVVELGGNLVDDKACNASQRIYIGNDIISSCNGGAGVVSFPELVNNGGYCSKTLAITDQPTSPSAVCTGGAISAITIVASGSGSIMYQWYSNTTSSNSNGIILVGATNPSYVPSSATAGTKYYYAVVKGTCSTETSNAVAVVVNPLPTTPTVGTITQPTCVTATGSVVLNGLPATGTWTLTRSPGGITSTGTGASTIITGLAAGTYTYTVTNASGCTSSASANVVINAQPSLNTWNGSVSTDWNTAGNWSCGGVPTISTDVLIPFPLASGRYPTIYVGGLRGLVRDIEIQSNATVTIEGIINISTGTGTGNALTIAGNLTLNGKIDLNGESQLIQNPGSTLDAASTGSIEIDQQGTGDSFNYNYWSSPANSNLAAKTYAIGAVLKDGTDATYKPIDFGAAYTWADGVATPAFIKLSTYWMYKLENSKGYAAWTRIGKDISIKAGEGYTMKGSNTTLPYQNYTFVGTPNNGDITLPLTKENDYLVGNPYPSAIDAWAFIDDNTATTGPLYFWEHYGGGTHNLAGYQGGYATYTKAGGVSASTNPPVAGVSTPVNAKKIPMRYIPVGQAFFVVGGAVNGDIKFNNGQRFFVKESQLDTNDDPYSVFMKSSNTKAKTIDTDLSDFRPKFRIGFDAPKISHRQLLLTVDENATPGVDRVYDAEIYEIFADDFYWILNNKKYVIQATNEAGLNSEVPLGIQLSKTGLVTVKIDALENVDDDTSVYLKDKLTGESFNMKEKPVQLNLTAGKYTDRFAITFKTSKLMAEDVAAEVLIHAEVQAINQGIHVFMNNSIGELQIKNNSDDEILSVALINSLGQTVRTWNSNFNRRTISLPINTTTGIYIVYINTKTGKTIKKISVE
ncbi:MAG TPA: T9SS type A sorting domain-containing protein [Lutibacter sp.]